MKSIIAKPGHQTGQICSAAKIRKRASRDADGELAHLERVVSAVRASTEIELPIGAAYWLARIHDLRVRYELLPVQLARLSSIEHCLKDYEQDKWGSLPIRRSGVASQRADEFVSFRASIASGRLFLVRWRDMLFDDLLNRESVRARLAAATKSLPGS
ncbi:hypothetical protein [Caballeronia grimmiae]|uniref:hypothetical protein n=1 Tax=Caballeronia grimmiae TaxID=1071679 RepID=UPI0038BCD0E6